MINYNHESKHYLFVSMFQILPHLSLKKLPFLHDWKRKIIMINESSKVIFLFPKTKKNRRIILRPSPQTVNFNESIQDQFFPSNSDSSIWPS